MNPQDDFLQAIEEYKPIMILALFSGGHDSLCSTHYISSLMSIKNIDIPFAVYHGNTGTGIKETREFVKKVCRMFEWDLFIRKPLPPYDYETLVKKAGFPGSTTQQHQIMYRNLKEKPLRRFITHEVKSSPYARENVLLCTGVRSSESTIRMGYTSSVRKDDSRIWANPIMDWSERDIDGWMAAHRLPRNPVKDTICISGECLCGCYAKPEEPAELRANYPEAWEYLQGLVKYSKWPWGSGGKSRFMKHNPPGQIKIPFMPMCVGCEEKILNN